MVAVDEYPLYPECLLLVGYGILHLRFVEDGDVGEVFWLDVSAIRDAEAVGHGTGHLAYGAGHGVALAAQRTAYEFGEAVVVGMGVEEAGRNAQATEVYHFVSLFVRCLFER